MHTAARERAQTWLPKNSFSCTQRLWLMEWTRGRAMPAALQPVPCVPGSPPSPTSNPPFPEFSLWSFPLIVTLLFPASSLKGNSICQLSEASSLVRHPQPTSPTTLPVLRRPPTPADLPPACPNAFNYDVCVCVVFGVQACGTAKHSKSKETDDTIRPIGKGKVRAAEEEEST